MIEIHGLLHDGRSSRAEPATLRVWEDGTVRLAAPAGEQRFAFAELAIAPRLGSTARRIGLPGGAELETRDNDAVDAAVRACAPRRRDWLHAIESRWGAVALATAFVLLAMALFALRGIPAIARTAAFATPPETNALLARGTLEVLDRSLEPSELAEPRRAELRAIFDRVTRDEPSGHGFELVFRHGGFLGANAFALPDGTVLLTDELVELAERDEQIEAVLAHEAGHVVERHGLRQAIQNSLVAVAIVLVVGDLSAASSVVAALPAALAEASFSREFEREADDHAAAYLAMRGMDPAHLAHLLQRMEEARGGGMDVSFLSTHPATSDRIERLLGERPAGEPGGEGDAS